MYFLGFFILVPVLSTSAAPQKINDIEIISQDLQTKLTNGTNNLIFSDSLNNSTEEVINPRSLTESVTDAQHIIENPTYYSFYTSLQDTINDLSHVRREVRKNCKVTGMFSYSDGYYYRTVNYEADENGFHITNENIKKIGNGPQFNPKGRADVDSSLLNKPYSVTIDDFHHPKYTGYKNSD